MAGDTFALIDNDHRTAFRADRVLHRGNSLFRTHRQNAATSCDGFREISAFDAVDGSVAEAEIGKDGWAAFPAEADNRYGHGAGFPGPMPRVPDSSRLGAVRGELDPWIDGGDSRSRAA